MRTHGGFNTFLRNVPPQPHMVWGIEGGRLSRRSRARRPRIVTCVGTSVTVGSAAMVTRLQDGVGGVLGAVAVAVSRAATARAVAAGLVGDAGAAGAAEAGAG